MLATKGEEVRLLFFFVERKGSCMHLDVRNCHVTAMTARLICFSRYPATSLPGASDFTLELNYDYKPSK